MNVWPSWKRGLYIIIFESDTKAGKLFDVLLLWAILISILIVTLESVEHMKVRFGRSLFIGEWLFTIIFTVEYFARIISNPRPARYLTSFFGIIDLLSILPTYLFLFYDGVQYLIVLRSVRLLRIFRVLKLAQYISGARILSSALRASSHKIIVFLGVVMTVVIIVGTCMYLIEGPDSGFKDIPTSIYWSIVTLTTVGFGDIYPVTPLGRILASFLMIIGYGIIAVPTGIVTSELIRKDGEGDWTLPACTECGWDDHQVDAVFCRKCGNRLSIKESN